jgi:ATP-dependent Clp protease protease subunit
MIHQPSGGMQGTAADIEIQAKEILRLREHLNQMLAKWTGQSADRIAADADRDFVLTAPEAVEYGLIDKVIDQRGDA